MTLKDENPVETTRPAVIVCEENEVERDRISKLLTDEYQVSTSPKISEALTLVQRGVFAVILLSFDRETIAQELNVIQAITILQKIDPDLIIIIMAKENNFGMDNSLALEREIRTKEIFYYILKPVEEEELKKVIREAISCSKRTKSTR
jgi:DNA-binding NtrC family response regulator